MIKEKVITNNKKKLKCFLWFLHREEGERCCHQVALFIKNKHKNKYEKEINYNTDLGN